MSGRDELDRFLQTDPRDVGCEEALSLLHVYVELLLDDATGAEAARRYPGVAAHLLACGPCSDDCEGLIFAASAPLRLPEQPDQEQRWTGDVGL